MKRIVPTILALFPLLILCSSCAAVFNKRATAFSVRTSSPAALTLGDSTVLTTEKIVVIPHDTVSRTIHVAEFEVPRGAKALSLGIESEFPDRTVKLRPRLSRQVWFNPMTYVYGVGLLADLPFPRAYDYPSRWVDLETGEIRRIRKRNNPYSLMGRDRRNAWEYLKYKGRLDLLISLSLFNTSRTYVDNAAKYATNSGSWGVLAGLEYFYADTRSVAAEIAHTSNFWAIVFPAWAFGGETRLVSAHASVYDNVHLGRFSFGYGLNLTYNWWRYAVNDRNYDDDEQPRYGWDSITQHSTGIGPMINAYWRIAADTRMGLIYRTSIYRIDAHLGWKYEHMIALDMKFNARLSRKR